MFSWQILRQIKIGSSKAIGRITFLFMMGACKIANPENHNYVTMGAHYAPGQLGGQLTAYAAVLGYAWANHLHPVFNKDEILNGQGGDLNYQYIFYRLPYTLPPDVIPSPIIHSSGYDPDGCPLRNKNICLCGVDPIYLPSYFHHFRDQIRQFFAPDERVLRELREKYAAILDHPKTVAVHIRTYHPNHPVHLCLGVEYYQNVMNHFSDDHLFIICSDRIDWCKKHLNTSNKNLMFIEGNNHIQELYLMSLCKNIIASNSTFSWWAAYLKKDDSGLIFVPETWLVHEDPVYRRRYLPDHYIRVPLTQLQVRDQTILEYSTTSLDD